MKIPDRTVILAGDAAKYAGTDYHTAMNVIIAFHSLLFEYLCRNFEIRLFGYLKIFFDCRIGPKSEKRYGDYTHPYYPERFFFVNTIFSKNDNFQVKISPRMLIKTRLALSEGLRKGRNEIIHKIIRYHDIRTFEFGDCSLRGRNRRRRDSASRFSAKKAKMAG